MNLKNEIWIENIFKFILFLIIFSLINKTKIIEIENVIKETLFQKDINFFPFETKYKTIAIYYPPYYQWRINSYHKNPFLRKIRKKYEYNFNKSLFEEQIKLAKNHGIFGFGIVQNLAYNIKVNEDIYNLFSFDDENKFPFFIIFDYDKNHNETEIKYSIENEEFKRNELFILMNFIQKYLFLDEYIKLKGHPILGFFNSPFFSKDIIEFIRNFELEIEKEKIYIISISNERQKFHNIKKLKKINSYIEYPSPIIYLGKSLNEKYFYNFYYANLTDTNKYKSKSKSISKFFIINGSKPEKFYIIFKKFLNLLEIKNDIFILFNSWNNYKENIFLEPSDEFGYSYLNYFSKAIFNISDNDNYLQYELESLNNKCKIAIQVHLFYKDLIKDIINKTNNIPVKFDLLISITNKTLYNFAKNYIKKYSKARYFEIFIAENKGRDIGPFLNQVKTKFRFYKYLCHIHTKKARHVEDLGFLWRNYLYNNLLGNSNIISEILNDFETEKKLGFIFPEAFYRIIKPFHLVTNSTKYWMNFLASKLFPNYKIGKLLNFPAGNMFWSKIGAIYQIFEYDFNEYFPKEKNQTEGTIMHAIERIWLYLVKYNDFYYKEIFYFY